MENLLSFIKSTLAFIGPISLTLFTIIIFSIISLTQDKFIKLNVKNKNSAVYKIILALTSIFISILVQFVFISQADINLKEYLKDKDNLYFFITTVTLITFMFSFIILLIKQSINTHTTPHYYLLKSDYQNLNISFKKLIILQKYEDNYICTFDRPTNPERIIINSNEIMNRKIHYSDDFDLFSELKIYNKLKKRLNFWAFFIFSFIVLFLLSLVIVITGLLFTISELPFFKSLSLDIFILSLFFIMLIFIVFFIIINFRTKKSSK